MNCKDSHSSKINTAYSNLRSVGTLTNNAPPSLPPVRIQRRHQLVKCLFNLRLILPVFEDMLLLKYVALEHGK